MVTRLLAGPRGARLALALLVVWSLAAPVAARPKKSTAARPKKPVAHEPRRSVATCARFDQIARDDDDAVDLAIDNRCEVRLACSVSWTLTCAPRTPRAQRFARGAAFALEPLIAQTTTASAADCGHDAWVLDDVRWSCRPEPLPPPSR